MRRHGYPWLICAGGLILGTVVVAADPPQGQGVSYRRPSQRDENPTSQLTENQGPWMIYVASFAGPGAVEESQALVAELRKRWRLPGYTYQEQYDFSQPIRGNGLNRQGQPLRMKHQLPIAYQEIAVLVGNYPSVDDPILQQTLKFVKYCRPYCLDPTVKQKQTALRFAGLRHFQRRISPDRDKQSKGPLGQAFVTRNPLLPEEFFAPRGVDSLVASMNDGLKYSLLECPGKYSVKVATFRGTVVIDQRRVQEIEATGRMESRLALAAENAHLLTEQLRRRKIEAYEFHDRYESVVTVGSFDELGTTGLDGEIELHP
ncbi:MAG TPA: hypothetical protein VIY86_03835, partial [Pirellulaceae bacterium]